MIDLGCFQEMLFQGNAPGVTEMVKKALDEGISAEDIVNKGLIPAMDQVGAKFKTNEIFVPEVMLAARAMQEGLKLLRPVLAEAKVEPIATIVIGTVKGDHHDIGKNLVAMMLEGAGFRVIDLGTDVSPEHFFTAAQEHHAGQVVMSALLTTTMPMMQKTIEYFSAQGVRDQVRFLVGGAPVSQAFADRIGADGYSADASSAVELAKSFLS